MADEIVVGEEAQKLIVEFVNKCIEVHKSMHDLRNKLEFIDIAYARHKRNPEDSTEMPSDVFTKDSIIAPVVASQVDSTTAYLADVFLSGYPLFPVVSSPKKRTDAEKLEVLLDDHAQLGGYVRELLLFLQDGAKYNIGAVEVAWGGIGKYAMATDYANAETGTKVDSSTSMFNKIKHLDLYNTFWDMGVEPAMVKEEGEFAGYHKRLNPRALKRHMEQVKATNGTILNYDKALSCIGNTAAYVEKPDISEYITASSMRKGVDWEAYFSGKKGKAQVYSGGDKILTRVYARITPASLGIRAPRPNHFQIWQFDVVNGEVLIEAKRLVSAYDLLPILLGQPKEDGFAVQTKSVAENAIPFQEAASTLYNIRFAAARRSVSDRALYDASMIDPKHVNSKAPAPKIPVRIPALSNKTIGDAYEAIPFDMRGTETTLSDARTIVGFSQELNGLNNAQQGQFQKGNKSVQEWNDVQGNAESRLRMQALLLECQFFTPLKQLMVFNIFQFGSNAAVVSQKTGETVEIDIAQLRKTVLSFRLADGYTPKARLASVDAITAGLNMLMNSPLLQQQLGQMVVPMFTHMMSLVGVRDLDQYTPEMPLGPQAAPQVQSTDPAQQSQPQQGA